jgi:N-acetyl-anhydromuramyl-L-alanine amidase AmpD
MNHIIKYSDFKSVGEEINKKQIILIHSGRYINDYLASLKFRYNGEYNKIPNYVVTREGDILQLLSDKEYSKIFHSDEVNQNSITICLENLGWLTKEPLTNHYVNWIGDIYNGDVFERKWRDYYFWQPYTDRQIEVTSELCEELLKNNDIPQKITGHNTKINGIEKFEGIVTRSNYESDYTDLSPAFNFENFLKKIENE